MKEDANFIAEKFKVSKKFMSEAVHLQAKNILNEQEEGRDKVTFKFEFVGIMAGDTQKTFLKFNSPALNLALVNNKAKEGGQKYAYLPNFIQMAINTLQTNTGLNPIRFEAQKSSMGDIVLSYQGLISKVDLGELLKIQAIPIVIKSMGAGGVQDTQPQTQTPPQPTAQPTTQSTTQQQMPTKTPTQTQTA